MKKILLAVGVLLLALPGYAQFTRTYVGALTLTDPVIPGDRLFRDGTTAACNVIKAYPGLSSGPGVHYDTYTIGNPSSTTPVCVTLTFAPTCTDATGSPLFVSVYSGSFVPANLSTNYKSDMGSSPNVGTTLAMGVTLAANEVAVLVVSGVTAASVCNVYSLTVAAPTVLPVQVSREEVVALSAYPNPVEDVLRIKSAKTGSYTLYNATGKLVKQITTTEVSLRDLPGGVYTLRQDATKAVTRIVKL